MGVIYGKGAGKNTQGMGRQERGCLLPSQHQGWARGLCWQVWDMGLGMGLWAAPGMGRRGREGRAAPCHTAAG